jgi:hypothetical protein
LSNKRRNFLREVILLIGIVVAITFIVTPNLLGVLNNHPEQSSEGYVSNIRYTISQSSARANTVVMTVQASITTANRSGYIVPQLNPVVIGHEQHVLTTYNVTNSTAPSQQCRFD